MKDMEDNPNLLETLLERASEYGKTSIELAKLKTLDKTTDIISSFIPLSVVIILFCIVPAFSESGISFMVGRTPWENILWILYGSSILWVFRNHNSFFYA